MLSVEMIDDGPAIHYTAVARGTPVYSADGEQVATVDAVIDNYREHILDGIVIAVPRLGLRFVDGPEVARTAERAVTLTISAAEVEALPRPRRGAATLRGQLRFGPLARLFGGGR